MWFFKDRMDSWNWEGIKVNMCIIQKDIYYNCMYYLKAYWIAAYILDFS